MIDMKMLGEIFSSSTDTTYDIEVAWQKVLLNDDARGDARRWLRANDPVVHRALGIIESEGVYDEAAQNAALVLMLARHIRKWATRYPITHEGR